VEIERMGKEIRTALLAGIAIALLLMAVIWIVFNSAQTRAPELVVAMLGDKSCVSPCFFGQPLRGKNIEQANAIIEAQPLMRDVAVRREIREKDQLIIWNWPDSIKPRLTSEGLSMDQYFLFPDEDLNYVQFVDGKLVASRFVFLIRIDELVALRGEPKTAQLGKYEPDVAALMLRYDDPSISFTGHFLCRLPKLYPYTRIWAYDYAAGPSGAPITPAVRWTGPETTQLSCDFPPG
jgi:hypothetical protein